MAKINKANEDFKWYTAEYPSLFKRYGFRAESDKDAKEIAMDELLEGAEPWSLTCDSDDGRVVFDSQINLEVK